MTQFTNLIPNSEFTGFTTGSARRVLRSLSSTGIGSTALVASASNSAGRWQGTAYGQGLIYYSMVATNPGAAGLNTKGFGFATTGYNTNVFGATTNYVALTYGGRLIYNNTLSGMNIGGHAAGDVMDFAIDTVNGYFWARRNGGFWNNVSTADPADPNPATHGGFACAGLIGVNVTAFGNANSAGDGGTYSFDPGTWTNAAPTGYGAFPVCSTPGWTVNCDPLCNVTVTNVYVVNGQTRIDLSCDMLGSNATGATLYAGLLSNVQPVTNAASYVHSRGASTSATTGGTSGRDSGFRACDDTLLTNLTGIQATLAYTSNAPGQATAVIPNACVYAGYFLGARWANGQPLGNVTITTCCPMFMAGTTVAAVPYCPTTGSVIAWEWTKYSTIQSYTLTYGTDIPSGVSSISIEGWSPSGVGGTPDNTSGAAFGGAGAPSGLFARRDGLAVTTGDTINFTIAAKLSGTPSVSPVALDITKGATLVLRLDAPTSPTGQFGTSGSKALASNCTGATTAWDGAVGGNGGTNTSGTIPNAGGGGGAAPPSRYAAGVAGGNASGTNGNAPGTGATALFGSVAGGVGATGGGTAAGVGPDPGGGPGGVRQSNSPAQSASSRGEVWVGWIVAGGTVNYKTLSVDGVTASSLLRSTAKGFLLAAVTASALRLGSARTIQAAAVTASILQRAVGKKVQAAGATASAIRRATSRSIQASATSASNLVRSIGRQLQASAGTASTASAIKVLLKTIQASAASVSTISSIKSLGMILQAAAASVSALRRATSRQLSFGAATASAIRKVITKRLDASTQPVSTLQRTSAFKRTLQALAASVSRLLLVKPTTSDATAREIIGKATTASIAGEGGFVQISGRAADHTIEGAS